MEGKQSEKDTDSVEKEVEPIAGAAGDKEFLNEFGDSSVCHADECDENDGLFPIGLVAAEVLTAIAPKTEEGETCVHA